MWNICTLNKEGNGSGVKKSQKKHKRESARIMDTLREYGSLSQSHAEHLTIN